MQLNGKDTSIQFRWIATTCRGVIGSISVQYPATARVARIAPYLVNATALPPSKNASGYYRFPAPSPYVSSSGNPWNAPEAFGHLLKTPSGIKLNEWIYATATSSVPLVDSHPWCVMTQLLPVNLSIGLTL